MEKYDGSVKIEFDLEEMVEAIKQGVVQQFSDDIVSSIKTDIYNDLKKDLLTLSKDAIKLETFEINKQLINEIYETETITTGGGWNKETKSYTLKEYVIEQIKDCIANNNIEGKSKSYSKTSFRDYLIDQCVSNEIRRAITDEINSIKDDLNYKITNIFNEQTKEMLSQTMLNILQTNESFKKIESSISTIANK